MSHVKKLDLKFLYKKQKYWILRFAIVQIKFQQTNKNKINHINDNHINIEVSLHFWGIWPTMWRGAAWPATQASL